MIFVQIKNGQVQNTITLEDESLVPLFQNDPNGNPYDFVIKVDGMYPQPSVGWSFDSISFDNPFEISAGNDTDVQYNNSGVITGSDNFTFDGNNVKVSNGVVSAVDFIYSRVINTTITVPNGCSMINSNMQLSGTITLLGDAELILL